MTENIPQLADVPRLAALVQDDAVQRAHAIIREQIAGDPAARSLLERDRGAIELGIHAGFIGALLALQDRDWLRITLEDGRKG